MEVKRKIYLLFGCLFFSLGLFGYYMPVMPGTIFMILAAYCFMNSSDKLYNKIINHPVYGNSVKLYIEDHVIPFRSKIIILLSIWISILTTMYIAPQIRYVIEIGFLDLNFIINVKIIGLALSVIGTVVVLRAKHQ